MPRLTIPYRAPMYVRSWENSLTGVSSNDSNSPPSSPSSVSSDSSSDSSSSFSSDSSPDRNSSATSNTSRNATSNSATTNSSATGPHSSGRMNPMQLLPPRNHNVRERDAQLRNRMQTRAVDTHYSARCSPPDTRQEESRQQEIEENPQEDMWMTILVAALAIGAFILFPGARRVFV